jgi:hypothetical protein
VTTSVITGAATHHGVGGRQLTDVQRSVGSQCHASAMTGNVPRPTGTTGTTSLGFGPGTLQPAMWSH